MPASRGRSDVLFSLFRHAVLLFSPEAGLHAEKVKNKTSILPLDPGIQGQDPPPKSWISEGDPAFTLGSRDQGARSYPLDPGIQGQDPGMGIYIYIYIHILDLHMPPSGGAFLYASLNASLHVFCMHVGSSVYVYMYTVFLVSKASLASAVLQKLWFY